MCNKIKFLSKLLISSTFLVLVDSNETLYGGDPKFLSEINKLCETLIGQILDHLKTLGRDEVRRNQKWQKNSTESVGLLRWWCATCSCSRVYGVRELWPFLSLVSCWLMGTWGTTNWASCLSTCGTSVTNTATARPGCRCVHTHARTHTLTLIIQDW